MRLTIFMVLLLFTCVGGHNTFAHVDKGVEDTTSDINSIRTMPGIESTYRYLRNGETTARTGDSTDKEKEEDDEERNFQLLNKLKVLFQRNTRSAAVLQKNPELIKQLESMKNNPAIMGGLKESPVTMKRLETLKDNPAIIKSLQKAPTEKNLVRLQSYLSGGQSREVSSNMKTAILFSVLIIAFAAPIALVALVTSLAK